MEIRHWKTNEEDKRTQSIIKRTFQTNHSIMAFHLILTFLSMFLNCYRNIGKEQMYWNSAARVQSRLSFFTSPSLAFSCLKLGAIKTASTLTRYLYGNENFTRKIHVTIEPVLARAVIWLVGFTQPCYVALCSVLFGVKKKICAGETSVLLIIYWSIKRN